MEKHKIALLVFCSFMFLLFSFSNVIAAPPVLSTVQSGSLEILAPSYDYVTIGLDKDIYWHVFNTTNLLTNATTTCSYHLYSQNLKGEHIVNVNNVKLFSNGRDFEVEVEGANFSTAGQYCHIIECNTSSQAGGLERCFTVTTSGLSAPAEENNANSNQLTFFIILLTITIGLLIFGIAAHDISVTIFASFAMTMIGLYMLNNGIPPYRTQLSQWIAIIIIFVGGYISVKSALDYFEVGGGSQ